MAVNVYEVYSSVTKWKLIRSPPVIENNIVFTKLISLGSIKNALGLFYFVLIDLHASRDLAELLTPSRRTVDLHTH